MPRREHPSHHRDTLQQPDRVAEALARLDQAVSAIHDSEDFRRYLDVQARFHRYSYGNVLLILSARPTATRVAGYRAWQLLGRQVRRGERGIKILVPMSVREREAGDGADAGDGDGDVIPPPDLGSVPDRADDPASTRRRLLFGVGTVFDLEQTEGEPLPEIPVPILDGDEGGELYDRFARVAQAEGLRIERGSDRLRPTVMGYYSPRERLIVVREAAPRQMTKTLAHELAHHFGQAGDSPPIASTPGEETIAESVAYVACSHFGVDTGERSFPYIATWSRDPRVFRQALTEIQARSHLLIERVHA